MMRITVESEPTGFTVLRLEGNLDGESATLLEGECSSRLDEGARLALDLTGIWIVDRAGTRALARAARAGIEIRCRRGVVAGVLEGEGIAIVYVWRGR